MKRIINFGLIVILNITNAQASTNIIQWDHKSTPSVDKLTATLTGYNYTTGQRIQETSAEITLNIQQLVVPSILFHTKVKNYKNDNTNISELGKCTFYNADGSTDTTPHTSWDGVRLRAIMKHGLYYIVLRDKLYPQISRSPFVTARCSYRGNHENIGGHKYEYETYIRNTGYKQSELVVTPLNFSIQANSDGYWKTGMINVSVTNLAYVNITVTGGDVILVGQSERVIRVGESVEIYSIPDQYKGGYDTESTGKFYLRGNAKKIGKNTYTLTINHNPV